MYGMQTIVTVVSISLSVSLSVTRLDSAACAVCLAHSLQPLLNYFGLLFVFFSVCKAVFLFVFSNSAGYSLAELIICIFCSNQCVHLSVC